MFDKTKIYTAVNADELAIGSKCYFANQLSKLKESVRENKEPSILKETSGEEKEHRFDDGGLLQYSLAYLIEPPKQYQRKYYRPFETIEEAREAITAHGGYLKDKDNNYVFFVTGYSSAEDKPEIFYAGIWYSLEQTFRLYVFDDDGSPCGSVEE